MVRLTNDKPSRNSFVARLARICDVNRIGNDWMEAGTFEPAEPKRSKKKPDKR